MSFPRISAIHTNSDAVVVEVSVAAPTGPVVATTTTTEGSSIPSITSNSLAALLDKKKPSLLILIDVRSSTHYASNHLRGAVHANTSCIFLKRLMQGAYTVVNLIPDRQRAAYSKAKNTVPVVVYDDASVQPSSVVSAVASSIRLEGRPVSYLSGGFSQFAANFPALVESSLTDCLVVPSEPCKLLLAGGLSTPSLSVAMTTIVPGVFLGNQTDASSRDALRAAGVSHVLNVTKDCPNYFETDSQLTYMRIPIHDTCGEDIAGQFAAAFAFIDGAVKSGGAVLVHCMAGISRSSTVVIAYLMSTQRTPLQQAYDFVKSKRPIVSPNLSFMGQLTMYERQALPGQTSPDVAPQGSHRGQISLPGTLIM